MISYIKWKIIDLEFNSVTILTNSWVGYELGINELIYSKLSLEEETELFVYHHKTEKKLFSELIKISWIWGKVAMQILSLWVDLLISSAKLGDNKTIESIKWIWKKMAEKIIIELRDKDFDYELVVRNSSKKPIFIEEDLFSSIKSTLTNMWYNQKDVENILRELPEDLTDAGTILPYAIKHLS